MCLITLRRGDALPVRVDTVEVLHLRHLIVGTNTSPRDQTSLIVGIDKFYTDTRHRQFPLVRLTRVRPLLVLLAYDLGYALVKILFYVARSPTVVMSASGLATLTRLLRLLFLHAGGILPLQADTLTFVFLNCTVQMQQSTGIVAQNIWHNTN